MRSIWRAVKGAFLWESIRVMNSARSLAPFREKSRTKGRPEAVEGEGLSEVGEVGWS